MGYRINVWGNKYFCKVVGVVCKSLQVCETFMQFNKIGKNKMKIKLKLKLKT